VNHARTALARDHRFKDADLVLPYPVDLLVIRYNQTIITDFKK
jgi:hypothetical protein